MTFKEFIGYLYEAVDCEVYIDRESKGIQAIEEVIGIDFKYFENKEIYFLLQGMKIMYEIERESWRILAKRKLKLKWLTKERRCDNI